jgi:predicted secreted protein
MAEHALSGKDILLLIDPTGGTTYSTAVCLNTHSFKTETNVIDATTKCGSDSLIGIAPPETIDFEGVELFDPASGKISGVDLYTLKQANTVFSWKIAPTTPVTGDEVLTGKGFISSLSKEYAKDAAASFSGTITVKGLTGQVITI